MSSKFELLSRPLVFVPVKWPGVTEGANSEAVLTEHHVDIQVELLDRDEFAEWMVDGNRDIVRRTLDSGEVDPSDTRTDADIRAERSAHELSTFKRVAKAWRNIVAQGRTPDFSDENIAQLLRFPGFVNAFGTAYMDTWRAKLAIREGNSVGSPAPGQAVEPTAKTSEGTTSSSPTS